MRESQLHFQDRASSTVATVLQSGNFSRKDFSTLPFLEKCAECKKKEKNNNKNKSKKEAIHALQLKQTHTQSRETPDVIIRKRQGTLFAMVLDILTSSREYPAASIFLTIIVRSWALQVVLKWCALAFVSFQFAKETDARWFPRDRRFDTFVLSWRLYFSSLDSKPHYSAGCTDESVPRIDPHNAMKRSIGWKEERRG